MESDASQGTHALEPAMGDPLRSLIASILNYLEVRLKILGLETREAGIQLLVLAMLLVSTIICFTGFVAMLIVFLLYLMMRIFHWEWGWSALTLSVILILLSIFFGLIFRSKIVNPFFPVTFAEFNKDRRWLEHTTKNSG